MSGPFSKETRLLAIAELCDQLSAQIRRLVESLDRERVEKAEREKNFAAGEAAADRIANRTNALQGTPIVGVPVQVTPIAGVPLPPKDDSPDGLSKLELKICQAIFHQGPLTKQQIAYFAGISIGSGSVIKAYADLLDDGILLSEGGRLVLDANKRVLELTSTFAPVPPRRSVYLKAFYEREGEHIAKIVGAVLQAAPNPSYDAVCSNAGISKSSGSTIKAFSRLKTLGILERRRGRVEVSHWFLDANAPEVRVRDSETGAERVHNAKTGMPRP